MYVIGFRTTEGRIRLCFPIAQRERHRGLETARDHRGLEEKLGARRDAIVNYTRGYERLRKKQQQMAGTTQLTHAYYETL